MADKPTTTAKLQIRSFESLSEVPGQIKNSKLTDAMASIEAAIPSGNFTTRQVLLDSLAEILKVKKDSLGGSFYQYITKAKDRWIKTAKKGVYQRA